MRLNWLSVPAGCWLAFLSATAEAQVDGGTSEPEATLATSEMLSDAPLAPFQIELLDLAFEAVTAMPAEPHIRNRSRAQEAVVTVCLELDQSRRALGYIEKIDNWLRGSAYADLAFYCVQHGQTAADVQHYLTLAGQTAEREEDWRRDQVRVKIARTYELLGQSDQATRLEAGVVDSESGKVAAVRALRLDASHFDEEINALDEIVEGNNFDRTRNALMAYAALYDRFYDNADRRVVVITRIKTAWNQVPVIVRLDVLAVLAKSALDHKDQPGAVALVNESRQVMADSQWMPEDEIQLLARFAALRAMAGEKEQARGEIDAALARFAAVRDSIVNLRRARTLRPIAEAYQSLGDTAVALSVYRKAVEEGVENPNSRPRAEDLSATCCSMASHKVEPDSELWTRIRSIQERLGEPW